MQPASPRTGQRIAFQSTPPVAGERFVICTSSAWRTRPVSIHAPRCRGAMPLAVPAWPSVPFVSIHAPRCRGAMRYLCSVGLNQAQFQSTPPVAGERCIDLEKQRVNIARVSIHAPRCRGAMLWTARNLRPRFTFQSTPPVAGERCTCPTLNRSGKV